MPKIKSIRRVQKRSKSGIAYLLSDNAYDTLCVPGYTSLDKCPEIMTAVQRIAETISMMTIHIMENTEHGDKRIINELSRKIDINPCQYMTRKTWIEAIISNLLLYGNGNSIVRVHTENGMLGDLEPVPASQVSFFPGTNSSYKVNINGVLFSPDEILHFVYNPDPNYLWKGQGVRITLKDVANILKQSYATEKAFMESPKPNIIIKVDALTDEFSNPKGRKKLLEEYITSNKNGEPWLIPAEQFSVEQVKPLTLADIQLSDTIQLNKRAVASIMGVPAFLLGVGEYKKEAWNNFVNTTIKSIVTGLQQEKTRKLILSPKWYIKYNIMSLLDWDLQTISSVFCSLSDRGFVSGNEVRDKIGMSPLDGLDEVRVLENYIPVDMSSKQKKLIQD